MIALGSRGLVVAMRCWCRSRSRSANPLPLITRVLSHGHAGVIAVVVNGLMTALRESLGREPVAGRRESLSSDEELVIGMLRGAPFDPVRLGKGELEHLLSAVLSARVMCRLIPGLD